LRYKEEVKIITRDMALFIQERYKDKKVLFSCDTLEPIKGNLIYTAALLNIIVNDLQPHY